MFKYNGKQVKSGQLTKTIMTDLAKDLENEYTKALDGFTCEIHGESATVTVSEDLERVSISGCCENFENKAFSLINS